MSIVVAVKKNGQTVMAAESLNVFGQERIPTDNAKATKIRRIGPAVMAVTGWSVYANILNDLLAVRRTPPLSDEDVLALRAGDRVRLSGVVYSARDSAHRLMARALEAGEALPFDPAGQVIYYMGPSPAAPGRVIGAAGPTTSGRMDAYAPALHRAGIKATIGKGERSAAVREALVECRAAYLAAVGGAGALLARATRGSRESKGIGKRAFYRQVDLDTAAAYDFATEVMAEASQTEDAREGMHAFLEKRPPRFSR